MQAKRKASNLNFAYVSTGVIWSEKVSPLLCQSLKYWQMINSKNGKHRVQIPRGSVQSVWVFQLSCEGLHQLLKLKMPFGWNFCRGHKKSPSLSWVKHISPSWPAWTYIHMSTRRTSHSSNRSIQTMSRQLRCFCFFLPDCVFILSGCGADKIKLLISACKRTRK